MIPQIEPWIDNEELEQLERVIQSTFLVEHQLTREFEEMTRNRTGAQHAVAVTNGTLALFCCLKALGIGHGDEVIIPDLTFIASANAVIMAGATPIFCDIDAQTFCLDVAKAERLISTKTKAIMPVHLYGQSADMEAVMGLAEAHGLRVIEDAAQGVGVTFNGKHVGTFGDFGVLSYYGNKTITCGEGGMILTDDDALARKCYRLKNHGREKKGVFIHEDIGFNFSFTEMQAAVGIAQMHKLDKIIDRKQNIHDKYGDALSGIGDLTPTAFDKRCQPVHWFTSFLTDHVEDLADFLGARGIQTRRFFYPLHLQPCYRDILVHRDTFEVSCSAYDRGISFPSSYNLKPEEQEFIISKIGQFYENRD